MRKDPKRATRPITLMADLLIAELRAEAHAEHHAIDDDRPNPPEGDPLSSAQSRRYLPVEIH